MQWVNSVGLGWTWACPILAVGHDVPVVTSCNSLARNLLMLSIPVKSSAGRVAPNTRPNSIQCLARPYMRAIFAP